MTYERSSGKRNFAVAGESTMTTHRLVQIRKTEKNPPKLLITPTITVAIPSSILLMHKLTINVESEITYKDP